PVPSESAAEVTLTIRKPGRVDGFLLWIDLWVSPQDRIDVLRAETSWLPVFLPVFSPAVSLEAGDTIALQCSRLLSPGEWTPDYLLRGWVSCAEKILQKILSEPLRNKPRPGSNDFYRALWRSVPRPSAPRRAVSRVDDWKTAYERLYEDAP